MSLRIPLAPDQTLAVEFHEIERRLRKLERETGVSSVSTIRVTGAGSSVPVNLSGILARLAALEAAIGTVDVDSLPNLGPVGAGAQKGLAPSPGLALPPTGVAQHLLNEDAEWGFPLRGLVDVSTSGEHTDSPYDVVNVSAGVHVSGPVSFGDVFAQTVRVMGYLIPSGILVTCEDDLSIAGLI